MRENEKNEAVASFVDLWSELASEETTSADVRWQKLGDAALATLNILRRGWYRLLDAVGRENPDVYQLVADALDRFNECPQMVDEDQRFGKLGLLPIFIIHRCESSDLPRNIGVETWLPRLPSGKSIPLLTDFLLTWEEVTNPSKVLRVHASFRQAPSNAILESLSAKLGTTTSASDFDGWPLRNGYQRSLRFVPFYVDSDSQPLIASRNELDIWKEQALVAGATSNLPFVSAIVPIAPMRYRDALWSAVKCLATKTLTLLMEEIEREQSQGDRVEANEIRLLIEPIGFQSLNTATSYRLSILKSDGGSLGGKAVFFGVNWRSRWASWETVTNLIAELAMQDYGLSSLTAPTVQEAAVVFIDRGAPRVLVVLGPDARFEPAEPETLAIESANDLEHEHAKWWDLERTNTDVATQAVREFFAVAVGSEATEIDVFPSFVIRNNGWRPAFIIESSEISDEGRVDEQKLNVAAAKIGLALGRKWVLTQQTGSEPFITP